MFRSLKFPKTSQHYSLWFARNGFYHLYVYFVEQDGPENEIIVVDRDVPPTSISASAADTLSHHSASPHTSPVTTSTTSASTVSDLPTPAHHPAAHITSAHHHLTGDSPVATMAAMTSMALTSPHNAMPGGSSTSPFMLMDHRFRLPAGDDMKCHVCNVSCTFCDTLNFVLTLWS